MALNYADEVLLLDQSELVAHGAPSEVLQPANIEKVFRVKSELHQLPNSQFLWINEK